MHERVGGVLLISMLFTFIGIILMYIITPTVQISQAGLWLALASSPLMALTWAGYFYGLQFYSTHKVVPLFAFTSIWLLVIELFAGGVVKPAALIGVAVLMVGGYVLDVGAFKWRIPSRLVVWFLPVTLAAAVELFVIKKATQIDPPLVIYFWHLVGIFGLGLLSLLVPAYRRGLQQRVQYEGSRFLLFSSLNEGSAQVAYLFGLLSVAYAPLAVYFSAATPGVQSLMLMILLFFKPLDDRNYITRVQWLGVVGIGTGVALLEVARLG